MGLSRDDSFNFRGNRTNNICAYIIKGWVNCGNSAEFPKQWNYIIFFCVINVKLNRTVNKIETETQAKAVTLRK